MHPDLFWDLKLFTFIYLNDFVYLELGLGGMKVYTVAIALLYFACTAVCTLLCSSLGSIFTQKRAVVYIFCRCLSKGHFSFDFQSFILPLIAIIQ